MVVLEYLTSEVEHSFGGDLLNTIHHVATTRGNLVSAPLFDYLLQRVRQLTHDTAALPTPPHPTPPPSRAEQAGQSCDDVVVC
jgi:hypothetical protein